MAQIRQKFTSYFFKCRSPGLLRRLHDGQGSDPSVLLLQHFKHAASTLGSNIGAPASWIPLTPILWTFLGNFALYHPSHGCRSSWWATIRARDVFGLTTWTSSRGFFPWRKKVGHQRWKEHRIGQAEVEYWLLCLLVGGEEVSAKWQQRVEAEECRGQGVGLVQILIER